MASLYSAGWEREGGSWNGITTVIADDDEDARGKVRYVLDRPGRRGHLKEWKRRGEQVRVKGENDETS